ncbi:hypothetical protein AB0B89_00875 [Sphaerisporangium sp. NPDC049002]|uniref:hypothetical protein n=1 Tax=unclassified Sphaerisporangium TaxID=2630420 RepID=UPI0033D34291
MDPGNVVVVVLGVIVVASALGVALVTIVLCGIRGENAQWPVTPDTRRAPHEPEITGAEARAAGIKGSHEEDHPEWTGRELAGDDLRPVGTHDEKHAVPGRARWW